MSIEVINEKELRILQVDILNQVVQFCSENNLSLFLAYGTLLGAVRHSGYIPWDDDIDIWMLRKDYDIFIRDFNKQNTRFKVHSLHENPSFPWPYAKVSNQDTILKESANIHNLDLGVNIDIFPIDNLSLSNRKTNKVFLKIKILRNILAIKYVTFSKKRSLYKNFIILVFKMLFSIIKTKKIVNKISTIAVECGETQSKYIACIVWNYGNREIFPRKYFETKTRLEFENVLYDAPVEYKKILKQIYGDYMSLPPKEKRNSHHNFISYWRKENENSL